MKSINAGRLRHRIAFEQQSTVPDAIGGRTSAWSQIFSALAEVRPLSGRELQAAQALRAEVTHEVLLRYRAELADPVAAAALRIRHRDRILQVRAAQNVEERDRWVVLQCADGGAA